MGGIETESVVEWDWDQEDDLKVCRYIFLKMNTVYLHLPAKWLGGRKPLGWGAGPYGDGAGWPEPNTTGEYVLITPVYIIIIVFV